MFVENVLSVRLCVLGDKGELDLVFLFGGGKR